MTDEEAYLYDAETELRRAKQTGDRRSARRARDYAQSYITNRTDRNAPEPYHGADALAYDIESEATGILQDGESVGCAACSDTGIVACGTCRSGGRVECRNCQGEGTVISFLAIQQTIGSESQAAFSGSVQLSEDELLQLDPSASNLSGVLKQQDDYEIVIESALSTLGAINLPPELENCAFPAELRIKIQELLDSAKAKAGLGKRILKQTMRIEEAKVTTVTYKYAGNVYQCKVVGKTKVLAPVNPLVEVLQIRQRLSDLKKKLEGEIVQATRRVTNAKKKLRVAGSLAWLDSTIPGKVLSGSMIGLAVVASLLFVPIGIWGTWGVAWTVLGGGWGLLFAFLIVAACLYPLLADKNKLHEWVEKHNAPILIEVQAAEAEVERLKQPLRDGQDHPILSEIEAAEAEIERLLQPDRNNRAEVYRQFGESWSNTPEWREWRKGFEEGHYFFLATQRALVQWGKGEIEAALSTVTDVMSKEGATHHLRENKDFVGLVTQIIEHQKVNAGSVDSILLNFIQQTVSEVVQPVCAEMQSQEGCYLPKSEDNVQPARPSRDMKDLFANLSVGVPLVEAIGLGRTGSGFLVKVGDRYLVVTNWHVVDNARQGLAVHFVKYKETGEENRLTISASFARVVAIHRDADVAIIDVHQSAAELGEWGIQPCQLAPISHLPKIGEHVFAIGHPTGGGRVLTCTLSDGIVSATGRTFQSRRERFIQVTAPINPGNSGSPLFDDEGRVVGMNTFMVRTSEANDVALEGLNFALEVRYVHEALTDKANVLNEDDIAGVLLSQQTEAASKEELLAQISGQLQAKVIGFTSQGCRPYGGTKDTATKVVSLALGTKQSVLAIQGVAGQVYSIGAQCWFAPVQLNILSGTNGIAELTSEIGSDGGRVAVLRVITPGPYTVVLSNTGDKTAIVLLLIFEKSVGE